MEITPAVRRNAALTLGGGVAAELAFGAGRQAFSDAREGLRNIGGRLYSRGSNALRQKLKRTRRPKSDPVAKKLKPSFDRAAMGLKRSIANPVLMGRFKRPRRPRYDPFSQRGCKVESHKDGGVAGARNLMIGGSPNQARDQLGYCVGAAVVKDILFRHTGFVYKSFDDVFTAYHGDGNINAIRFGGRGWDSSTFKWSGFSVDITVDGVSLHAVATDFLKHVWNTSRFHDRTTGSHLSDYQLRTQPYGTAGTVDTGPLVSILEMYVRCYCFMNIDIQNVTQSDGANKSTEVVDTNPLKGLLYHFRQSVPTLRVENLVTFQNVLVPGSDGTFSGDGDTHGVLAPLDANSYHRCTGVSRVVIPPGGVKRLSVGFKYDGLIKDLLIGSNPKNVPGFVDGFGVSRMVHLEKAMNTGSSVNVSINYNLETRSGCFVKKIKRQPGQKLIK